MRWQYPSRGLSITLRSTPSGLDFRVTTQTAQPISWPNAGNDPAIQTLILPLGAGVAIPSADAFWRKTLTDHAPTDLFLPFWAIRTATQNFTFLTPQDNRLTWSFTDQGGRLTGVTNHALLPGEANAYQVLLSVSDASVLAPAQAYRQWLIEQQQFVALADKIASNPETEKLLGAFHVWLYGTGWQTAMLDQFQTLGADRLWLGYSLTAGKGPDASFVQLAKQRGYLIGPYDSFYNAQDPSSADDVTSVWPDDLYPNGCVIQPNGKPLTGFAGRGCYLSSEALRQQDSKDGVIAQRVQRMTSKGDNSYFLDVDAASDLYEDASPAHPMTAAQDRANRLARMRYISQERKLVLGSEDGKAWAGPAIAFSNGGFTGYRDLLWPVERDKTVFGAYYPPTAPRFFFQPIKLPSDLVTCLYDPAYRVPLYEAVMHGSVISTDRWELSYLKTPDLIVQKALLQSLYNVPAIWALDAATLKQHAEQFKQYYQFFSPLHRLAGKEPLTEFRWLTEDRLVQQTTFGDVLTMTANFSSQVYQGLKPGSIEARDVQAKTSTQFIPSST
ncbi:MAG: glycoside hydrolase [Thermomicrobiales bacterium]